MTSHRQHQPQRQRGLKASGPRSAPSLMAVGAIPTATERAIVAYFESLRVERRLAATTCQAYKRDITDFFTTWQQPGQEAHLALLTPPLVIHYLADQRAQGRSARSRAPNWPRCGASTAGWRLRGCDLPDC